MNVISTTLKSLKGRAPKELQQLSSGNKEEKVNKKSKTTKDSVVQAESVEDSGQPETHVQSDKEKELTNDDPVDEKMDEPKEENHK
jgi:hypothetical protein